MAPPILDRFILVVDDNREAADLMVELLTLCGHTAISAYNGPDGVSIAVRAKPEIILLDLTMPVMDGFEVARKLRANDRLRATVLVAFTALSDDLTSRRIIAEGFDFHLTKPASIGRVMDVISKARCRIDAANEAPRGLHTSLSF
jgi:CheY-like chemotaxis protein